MINKLKFILLSLLGVVFFLVPFEIGGESRIMISHIIYLVTDNILDEFLLFTEVSSWIVLLGTVIFLFYTSSSKFLNNVFKASPINVVLRLVGSFLYLMVINEWFAGNTLVDAVLDPDTGGLMAGGDGLLTTLYITFFVGLLALPLLTHFGMVEFIGIILGPVVEKVFKVPGYAMIDGIASFVGDGTIGIVVTDNQYQRGYYNKREAYIISTSFSIVGIAFAAAVADLLGFSSIFPIFYGTILLVTLILAFITARMPLKKFEPTYYENTEPKSNDVPDEKTVVTHAYDSAVEEAEATRVGGAFIEAVKNIVHIYVGFLPIIMAVGTVSLIIAEYTAFFDVISVPFIYIYQLLGFSSEVAAEMAPASLAGFADMYLPALFISGSVSEAARFFIGVLAFTQLVFMSETGMILVKTEIGLNFWDVTKVFIFRTILSIPVLYLLTQLLSLAGVLSF
ncbi:putative arginine uptake transporter [Alkalibacterium sp. AK22]|uniref:YjiH family protein n=1 Tax=Alkalibacterium sp. AK22 TaxID=1229520 RepID=UPI000450DFDD|nr:nucleoside recognition domain-containing protein [Alkalibacterium sp. AK22]EXJ22957.1 putative arginine uptake transporter [Alkalibacterium sp. AK22]